MRTARSFWIHGVTAGAALAAVCAVAAADTVKVKKGDDLQAAIDGAADGDTIVVRSGTYAPVTLNGRKNLTIKGRGRVVVDGSSADNCIHLIDCSGVTLRGLTLKDSQVSALRGDGCTDVTVRSCKVKDAGDEGIDFANSERVTIERNRVDGTEDDGIAVGDSKSEASSSCTISKNRISGAADGGIDINGDDNVISKNQVRNGKVNGVYLGSGTGNRFEKNLIQKIDGVGAELHGDGAVFTGNKILKPTGHGVTVEEGGHEISKNVVTKAGGVGVRVQSQGNQVTRNVIKGSGDADLQDTTGSDGNTYVGNRAKVLDPEDLPNPKR